MDEGRQVAVTRSSVINFREVTGETVRDICRLKVAPGQEGFVAPNAVSIAEAYFDHDHAWFRAIYADETPVGFFMLYLDPGENDYELWRFMIDACYQGLGFGRRSLELIIAHARSLPGATEFSLSCVPAEGSAGPFYEKLGFRYTGEEEDGELEMLLEF